MFSLVMNRFCLVILTQLYVINCFAQSSDSLLAFRYNQSLISLNKIIVSDGSFKDAVLLTEQAFLNDSFSFLNNSINIFYLKNLCNGYSRSNADEYHWRDSLEHKRNLSVFKILTHYSYLVTDTSVIKVFPFHYSFTDPFGKQDWSNMFVTKLLSTHEGNCHSLAYLYKILADEVGAKCWFSLAPNHIYIKNYSEKLGWYNTELTSGTFPTDAWVMVSGYVNPEAIKSGMYMDTLSNQQSIALCVLDLAKEYEFQTHNYYDGFILKCCNLVLQYHPVNPMALLLKAETLKKVWVKEREERFPKLTSIITDMQNAYTTLAKLGYREMPDKMYQQWLREMVVEKEKYTKKEL